MRKIAMLIMTLCLVLMTAVASAAQVTDAKWGVDKNNVLRFVVDMTGPSAYNVELTGSMLTLTVDAKWQGASRSTKLKSQVASTMQVAAAGEKTVIKVPLNRSISTTDYKAFTLKQDPKTNRPYRVVLDITADKKAAAAPVVTGKTTTSKPANNGSPVVSNKPVVSNRPVSAGQQVAVAPPVVTVKKDEPKKEIKQDKEDKKDKDDKEKDKKKDKEKADKKPVKGSGKYETRGGLKGKVITLDPGHGGTDPGAIGKSGLKEKEVTLAISKKVQELLKKKGAKVYMTRTTDVDVYGPYAGDAEELQARVNVAERNNSDLFISLHINSSVNKNIGGFTSYYYPKTTYDGKIAKAIQNQLTANFGVDDLGVREANFYVTKRCSMPATLLELCFISNPKEEKLMKGNWFQNKTAKMIVEGIEDYFK